MALVYTSNQGSQVIEVVESSGGTAQLVPLNVGLTGLQPFESSLEFGVGVTVPPFSSVLSAPLDVELGEGQFIVSATWLVAEPGGGAVFAPITIDDSTPGTALLTGQVINPAASGAPLDASSFAIRYVVDAVPATVSLVRVEFSFEFEAADPENPMLPAHSSLRSLPLSLVTDLGLSPGQQVVAAHYVDATPNAGEGLISWSPITVDGDAMTGGIVNVADTSEAYLVSASAVCWVTPP